MEFGKIKTNNITARINAPVVAVIGSGVSGLAAGFRLRQAGYRVRLFEQADRLGGKMCTTYREGFISDDAASIVISSYSHMLRLLHDAGLDDELLPGGSVSGFTREGRIHYLDSKNMLRDFARTDLFSFAAKASLVKLAIDSLGVRSRLDPEDLSRASDRDVESAADYARRRLHPEILEYLVEPAVGALFGDRARNVSSLIFLYAVNHLLGGSTFAFRNGMEAVVKRLASGLDAEVNAHVLDVEDRGGEVKLRWRDSSGKEHDEFFAGSIVAVPAPAAATMLPTLDSWRRDLLAGIEYIDHVNVKIALSVPPPPLRSVYLQVSPSTDAGLVGILVDNNKAPGLVPPGKGMLGFYTSADWASELIPLDDANVVAQVVDRAERIIPRFRDGIAFTQVHRWGIAPRARPGFFKEMRHFNQLRLEQDRRIQLAGDYFSCANLDTAAAAGERAARELVTVLTAHNESPRVS